MMSNQYDPGGSSFNYLITQPYVILNYFITFFLPLHLSADTDLFAFTTIFDIRFYAGVLFLVFMFWFMFYASTIKELRPASFGLIWFFIALLPTSSFIPLSEVLNDHRIFYPFIGLALACANISGYLYTKYLNSANRSKTAIQQSRLLVLLLVLIIVGGNAYGVHQRNKVWHDEETLWLDVTIKSPKNGRGLMNYGLTQMSKGNYPEALKYFEKALVYNPYYSYLHINMGIIKNALNQTEEAEAYFKKAISLDQTYYGTYYYYASFLNKHKRYAEAIPMYEKAIELSPTYLNSSYELMQIYYDNEQWDKLRQLAQRTLNMIPEDKLAQNYLNASQTKKSKTEMLADYTNSNPTPENYLNLSLAYYQEAQYEKCIDACLKAIKIRPNYAEAYNNICSAYNALGKWQEAINACEKALKLKPDFPLANGNLNYAKKILKNRNK
jgi:protein O-mannosyl-transferase